MASVGSSGKETIADEFREMVSLAWPVVLAELGWMAMSVVDTVMVGTLGPAAIGAIGVGISVYYSFAIFGMGLLFGLDTLIPRAWGAGDKEDCHHSLVQGLYLAGFLSIPLTAFCLFLPTLFYMLGINPEVSRLAGPFVSTLAIGTLPLLLYGALRRYLQGIGQVRPVMFALVSANLVNLLFNWLLIRGHWGFPALGVVGSALSTCVARTYMAGTLALTIWLLERKPSTPMKPLWRKPDFDGLRELIRIGFPAATQILLEIGAFGAATILAGRLTTAALAAHQIALNIASVTYMVPLGTSSAAAVAVGHALGRGEPHFARRRGYLAIVIACTFMLCSAVAFLVWPRWILGVYTSDAEVIKIGTSLLSVAAVFQLFDGIQTVTTGALRGLGNTQVSMIVNFVGYWLLGLPIGYVLCFRSKAGVYGLWWGLTLSLIVIALWLLASWNHKSKNLDIRSGLHARHEVQAG